MFKNLNKGISTSIAVGIVFILVALVGSLTWWQYGKMWRETGKLPEIELPEKKEIGSKDCSVDENCLVFGQDGDCNCGCFNKNYNWKAEGVCFCAAPSSCKCVEGKCEDVF